ncbi:TraR/DksA family transcriptional regulator [Microbacterium aquimaris]|uniref:TraR/DksA family transcriptional regulator n=1 Tax=Microbacterium aquimaris TaxID=459816 RepID=A0ABU5N3C6_9MICO|nr:TraR/DksA family transcriptional regulator [Microbacterium aquimaris]MDZ8160589.1 TraR/DksA family transcriptional regulator [Microbacterium aquimaris]
MTGPDERLRRRRADVARRLAHITDEIDELRGDRGAESADDEHDPEGVTLSAEWSRLEGLRAAASTELDDIDAALGRRASGTYGMCLTCERAIPVARLRVRPDATRCVDCATASDR